jgi:2-keto-4-pentenoate hydratase/2-oxohepta-3-ene-1,7-dioic acid hydratase in catechol pathway
MRLLRFADAGRVRLGAVRDDTIVALDPLETEFPTIISIVKAGATALERIADFLRIAEPARDLAGAHLLCPIERPGKYLAIGMNYRKHLEEAKRIGIEAPAHQLWFNKQTSCLAGPYDDIDPGVTEALDYEVELGLVIGRPAKKISEASVGDHIFGYFVANDISARDWQRHSPTFTIGKSFDTHGPIGPWIVTADEIEDPHALGLRCLVNGELRQESSTSQMIFNVWQQVSYLSTAFTLEPGDLISTGTPEGVGITMNPPTYLKAGDIVRCEIDGVGVIENRVRRRSPNGSVDSLRPAGDA